MPAEPIEALCLLTDAHRIGPSVRRIELRHSGNGLPRIAVPNSAARLIRPAAREIEPGTDCGQPLAVVDGAEDRNCGVRELRTWRCAISALRAEAEGPARARWQP